MCLEFLHRWFDILSPRSSCGSGLCLFIFLPCWSVIFSHLCSLSSFLSYSSVPYFFGFSVDDLPLVLFLLSDFSSGMWRDVNDSESILVLTSHSETGPGDGVR